SDLRSDGVARPGKSCGVTKCASVLGKLNNTGVILVAPVCKEDRIVVVGASRGESLNISCRVEADPPVHNFRWKFNNSGETLEVSPQRFTVPMPGDANGISVLKYTPATELDYGTLSCWADNEVGSQAKPCLFQIVAAGKPFPVRNCSLANQTYTSVEVKCIAGYDGGLPQRFVLEVYHGDLDSLPNNRPLYNVSSNDAPIFALSSLKAPVDAGVHVAVYAVNAKGRSQAVVLSEVTFRDAEKRTGTPLPVPLPKNRVLQTCLNLHSPKINNNPELIFLCYFKPHHWDLVRFFRSKEDSLEIV
ncbi:hypothetical protein PV326_007218, partial [Microctonus aethiopoides]